MRYIPRPLIALLLIAVLFGSLPAVAALDDNVNVFSDPDRFSQWTVVGPNGGDVRVVAVDPRDKNKLYLTTLDGQIHTSDDAGKTWRLLASLNEPSLVLDQFFVDSRDSKVIYASGHRGLLAGGFFKSTDGGVTWKKSKELAGEAIHAMTQSTVDPNVLFVGTMRGVFISKDSGDDWEKIDSPTMPMNINSMAVDPRNNNTIYAGTNWRPYKSTDGGRSWRLVKDGMIDDSDVFAINIDPRNAEHIIASACSGIYESFNGGERWAKIQGIPAQSRRTRDIVQHPSKAGTVYAATTEGFWMSTNSGKSWILTTHRNLEINSIAVHPDEPNRVFIGTNNFGVMVSNDGGKTFSQTNQSFTSRFTYSVTPDLTQPNRLYALTQNTASSGGFFFYSSDGGTSWQQTRSLDINRVSPMAFLQDRVNPDRLYLGTNVGIYRSLDRGVTWTLLAPPKPPAKKAPAKKAAASSAKNKGPASAVAAKTAKPKPAAEPTPDPNHVPALTDKVRVLAFTEDGRNGLIAGTDKGLYRTYDIDKGWDRIPFGEGIDSSVFAVQSSPLVPATIWVGTATSGVIVTTDDGKTWSKVGGIPSNIPISSIAVDPKRPNYIYVGSIQSFYLSRDGGRTWLRRGGNLPLGNYTSILINPTNTDEMLVSSSLESDGGIYFSEDAGMKWKRVDTKKMTVPSRRVWSMAFDPSDPSRIYAGSHSSGVYRIDLRSTEAKKRDSAADVGRNDGN
ncbi:MAG: WD40/YVTN/BNR-like repeat-containing protein [Pyrinomonadaceae bacterium]